MIALTVFLMSGCKNVNKNGDEYNGKINEETRDVFAMDTYMTLTAYGENAKDAIDEAVDEIHRLDDMFSVGNKDSEVSILNQNGSEIISEETEYLFETALQIYKNTEGCFDITVYPLMVEWGFTNQKYNVPKQDKIDSLLKNIGTSKIEFDKKEKLISVPDGVEIDFGGIAKGYTSQRIMQIFKKYELVGGVVSLGGNVQTYGRKPNGEKFRIGVEDPFGNQDYVGILNVENKAIITSGGYERFFEKDGVKYHHILDPKTGYPAETGLSSVTIVGEDGTMADGLSTALFVMGKNDAVDYWKKYAKKESFDMILVEDNGKITITEGLEKIFTSERQIEIVR
ncbi:MAG: FAD:protein FMN transferase [Lachnospiraceae bacterium]|nr:FAD:protein FMN transferase [Lachnospiraceae bacterium]